MEIKARCKYDLDAVKALTHLSIYKKSEPKKRLLLWSAVFFVLFVVIVFEIITFHMDTYLFVLLCIVIFVLLQIYFGYFIAPKIRYKSLANMKDAENEYIFCNNVLKAFTKSKEYNGEAEIEYSLFLKVYETSKYLFLFQTDNQVFIVDKFTIEGGSVEEIRNKLSTFLRDNYIICKY